MIQQITQLPTPPQPSDSPTDFDQKSFALLGGLPQFVTEANALGTQVFDIGEDATESATQALASKNAAATSASSSADSANASSQSASNSASSANAANQSRIEAEAAASTAVSIAGGMGQAIAMAQTFTAVPTTFQAWVIFVTLPHWRTFIWTGSKYERAPWHRPGRIVPYDGPVEKVTDGIQLRSDVLYETAKFPDLADYYGFTGPTFVLKDGRARVIRGADLGRNIDSSLVNGYLQEDAIRNVTGSVTSTVWQEWQGTGVFQLSGTPAQAAFGAGSTPGFVEKQLTFNAALQVPTASENRVKSLVATHYVTI